MRFCLLSLLSAASVHAQGYPEAPETAIYPERFSPTTDIVSFSPAAWLMQPYHPLTPTPAQAQLNTFEWFGPGNSLYGLHSMVLMSRACKLEMGEPDTCYFPLKSWGEKGSPFDHVHSDSTDARYTFVREDSLTRADSWNPFCVYNGIDGGCGRGSRNSWTREVAEWPNVSWPPKYSGGPCNSTGVLGAYAQYGAYYHMADQMFSNCRWTVNESQAAGYIREVAARTNDRGESYDYSFEVCQWPGDCTTETGNCINAYSAVFLADLRYTDATSLLAVPQEEDFFPVPPRQYPPMGAGRIEMVYSTASNGPHLPCSVDDDGQQLPCGVPGAEAEEEDLVIHISKLKVLSTPNPRPAPPILTPPHRSRNSTGQQGQGGLSRRVHRRRRGHRDLDQQIRRPPVRHRSVPRRRRRAGEHPGQGLVETDCRGRRCHLQRGALFLRQPDAAGAADAGERDSRAGARQAALHVGVVRVAGAGLPTGGRTARDDIQVGLQSQP